MTNIVPFLLPLSQTFLTISVYSVIAITLQGVVYIQANRTQTPVEESTDQVFILKYAKIVFINKIYLKILKLKQNKICANVVK